MNKVIPILNSIVAADGCQLKHVQLPLFWCEMYRHDADFGQFISRYNVLPVSNVTTATALIASVGHGCRPMGSKTEHASTAFDTIAVIAMSQAKFSIKPTHVQHVVD